MFLFPQKVHFAENSIKNKYKNFFSIMGKRSGVDYFSFMADIVFLATTKKYFLVMKL